MKARKKIPIQVLKEEMYKQKTAFAVFLLSRM
jgi:hypothetical protein